MCGVIMTVTQAKLWQGRAGEGGWKKIQVATYLTQVPWDRNSDLALSISHRLLLLLVLLLPSRIILLLLFLVLTTRVTSSGEGARVVKTGRRTSFAQATS